MALINPCDIEAGSVSNTGIECSSALGVAKGIFIVPANYTWTEADMLDTQAFIRARIHASGASRWYPVLKGIFDFALAAESDVTETNPITGTTSRLRAGGFTLTYTFKEGGLCLAKSLLGFGGKGYRFIAVDENGQLLVRRNADGTFSGLISSDITNSIIPASASASFKNTLVLGVSQNEYIKYAGIIKPDEDVTDVNGLIDVQITKPLASTATILKIGVRTECAKTDLIAKYSTPQAATDVIVDLDLFVITNKATGVVVTPTAIAKVAGNLHITGTWVSGQTYTVKGSAPSVWLSNLIEGYDATVYGADILIP